jgi:hypothetical protein
MDPIARAGSPCREHDGATIPDFAQTPSQDEANALVVAQASLKDEASIPAVDHSSPPNEAIGPAGDAGRPVRRLPSAVRALLPLILYVGLIPAFPAAVGVIGPDSSPPARGGKEKSQVVGTKGVESIGRGSPRARHIQSLGILSLPSWSKTSIHNDSPYRLACPWRGMRRRRLSSESPVRTDRPVIAELGFSENPRNMPQPSEVTSMT